MLGKVEVIDSIIRNSLKLPKDLKFVLSKSPQLKLTTNMINKLQAACDKRKEAFMELLSYEFTNVPECLVNKNLYLKPFPIDFSEIFSVLKTLERPQKICSPLL